MRTQLLIPVENLTKPREYGVDLFFRASERFKLLRMALIGDRRLDDEGKRGPGEGSNEATFSVLLRCFDHSLPRLQGRL